ncbi:hypothetical protein MEO41_28020, partial [Dolichospermum sp. ST_sed4]|nr:hypothetical protein [Dolichospermum sp. ST_sed4]
MTDVLKSQADLYSSQTDFASSEYDYMNQLITLKQQAGILDENDLIQINSWLTSVKERKQHAAIKKIREQVKKSHKKKAASSRITSKKGKKHQENKPETASTEEKQEPVGDGSVKEGSIVAVSPSAEAQANLPSQTTQNNTPSQAVSETQPGVL